MKPWKKRRIAAVQKGIEAHAIANGSTGPRVDRDAAVVDVVTNLFHYIDQHGMDREKVLRLADMHFAAEHKSNTEEGNL